MFTASGSILSSVPVDGEGLRDPQAYKIALVLTWIAGWAGRILFIPIVVYVFVVRPVGALFFVVWSVLVLLAVASLVFLQRSGIRLASMFYFDEVEEHARMRAFFAKAMQWRRPW
jgi:hypothetical protein